MAAEVTGDGTTRKSMFRRQPWIVVLLGIALYKLADGVGGGIPALVLAITGLLLTGLGVTWWIEERKRRRTSA